MDFIRAPWPWYVAGPLIGLVVPALLLIGSKRFDISVNLQTMCSVLPGQKTGERASFFGLKWHDHAWNMAMLAGIFLGGVIVATLMQNPDPVAISDATRADLSLLGVTDFTGLVPSDILSFENLGSAGGLLLMVGGGFLIGFGARYAGGCTSGHAITGLADLQPASLIAIVGFFAGGLVATHLLLPLLLAL